MSVFVREFERERMHTHPVFIAPADDPQHAIRLFLLCASRHFDELSVFHF